MADQETPRQGAEFQFPEAARQDLLRRISGNRAQNVEILSSRVSQTGSRPQVHVEYRVYSRFLFWNKYGPKQECTAILNARRDYEVVEVLKR